MDMYPSRVTLFDDGLYRWSYDMDMWHNRYLLGLIIKILCIALGIPTLFVAVNVLKNALPVLERGMTETMLFIHGDLLSLTIISGIWIGSILLTLIIYAICAAVMHGVWHLCFEMDESSVALVQSAETKARNSTLAAVAAVVEIAALFTGKSNRSLHASSSALRTANESGITSFDSVRRVRLHPDYDLIDLREFLGMNQIYVELEDYPFVRDFILERMKERARP